MGRERISDKFEIGTEPLFKDSSKAPYHDVLPL